MPIYWSWQRSAPPAPPPAPPPAYSCVVSQLSPTQWARSTACHHDALNENDLRLLTRAHAIRTTVGLITLPNGRVARMP